MLLGHLDYSGPRLSCQRCETTSKISNYIRRVFETDVHAHKRSALPTYQAVCGISQGDALITAPRCTNSEHLEGIDETLCVIGRYVRREFNRE